MATCYKFNLSTYVHKPLAIGRRGCTGRDLNEEMFSSRQLTQESGETAVMDESDVSEGVKVK